MKGMRRLIIVLALAAVAGSIQPGLVAAETKYCSSQGYFREIVCNNWCGGPPAYSSCSPCSYFYCECASGQWWAGIETCAD
jgi:hypothetical protein